MSKEDEEFPATYSVRLPTMMRKQLDENARQHGRSLHAEILLRLSASLGESKSGFSEKINDLGENEGLSDKQREEVLELIRQELGK
ncbi:MAG: Arc family DNA-binding protein [Thiolinea sp.]